MFENSDVMPRAGVPGVFVLGWRERPCLEIGHNAGRALAALRAEDRAVLLVRTRAPRPYGNALFPTDLSPASLRSLRRAIRTLPRMRFTLLHTCRIAGEGSMRTARIERATLDECRRRVERRARAAGQRFVAQLPPVDARLLVQVARQPWAVAVAIHASAAPPDVLVLTDVRGGCLEHRRWRADLRMLLRRTACDLLLLPHAHAG